MTAHRPFLRIASGHDGFIVVAVLWILAALATLATIFSVYVINTATAFAVHDERLQAEALATAAIELSVYQISANAKAPPTRGTFVFRAGNATVSAEFSAETARIDLNTAPKELLAGLFTSLGAAPGPAQSYADRIVGWRSPPSADLVNNEASNYRVAGLPYGPRGGLFPHAGELALVMGIPELLVQRALPFLTVYSGTPQVNIIDADPQVLAALPGMDPSRLHAILVQRAVPQQNAQVLQAMLGPAQAFVTTQGSKSVRVTARMVFDSRQRMATEAVIFMLDSGAEPYRVLTWRDDVEDAPPGARAGAAR
jgi:general secretion pathway protein K